METSINFTIAVKDENLAALLRAMAAVISGTPDWEIAPVDLNEPASVNPDEPKEILAPEITVVVQEPETPAPKAKRQKAAKAPEQVVEEAPPVAGEVAEPEPETVKEPEPAAEATPELPPITDTELQRFCGRVASQAGGADAVFALAAGYVAEGDTPRPTNIKDLAMRWAFIEEAEAKFGVKYHG